MAGARQAYQRGWRYPQRYPVVQSYRQCMHQVLDLFGEPAGTRTQDPVIKSHVLYRLSYRLVRALHTEKWLP